MKKLQILITGLVFLFTISNAYSAEVANAILTYIEPTGCEDNLESTTTFYTSDSAIYVYIEIDNAAVRDTDQFKWYYEGELYTESDIYTYESAGSFCLWSSLPIDSEVVQMTGDWDVEYYYNGVIEAELPFTLGDSSSSTCAASAALGDDSDSLRALRKFRDEVLGKSAAGNKFISLFYKYSPDLISAMGNNPMLKASFRQIFKTCAAVIDKQ